MFPEPAPRAATQVLQTGTSGHFTKPLSPHENQPFLGSPEWPQVARHRVPAELCAVVLPGGTVPQAWEEPSADGTDPTEGVRSMRKGIRMPPESQPKGQGRRERTGWAVRSTVHQVPPEPCARHPVSAPERSTLVEQGSNPRSSPELLCELWAGEFTSLSSSGK